jgi:hypothetical protein
LYSFQRFPYEMRIQQGAVTAVTEAEAISPIPVGARFNLLGQRISPQTPGWQLVLYRDGTVRKVFRGGGRGSAYAPEQG